MSKTGLINVPGLNVLDPRFSTQCISVVQFGSKLTKMGKPRNQIIFFIICLQLRG